MKIGMARLAKERDAAEAMLVNQRMELAALRVAAPDPQEVEAEVQRRVKLHMSKIHGDVRSAIDHTLGLSTILTTLLTAGSRASQAQAASLEQTPGVPRHSDVGGVRMRQVVARQPGKNQTSISAETSNSTWARTEDQSPRQLSKVG